MFSTGTRWTSGGVRVDLQIHGGKGETVCLVGEGLDTAARLRPVRAKRWGFWGRGETGGDRDVKGQQGGCGAIWAALQRQGNKKFFSFGVTLGSWKECADIYAGSERMC